MQPLVLPVGTRLGDEETEGRGGPLGPGPCLADELTFGSSACVSGPNGGVMGGEPAPGKTPGCFGTCSEYV